MALIISTPVPFKALHKENWQNAYDQFIDTLGNFLQLVCPHCHTRGRMRLCRTYQRYFYNCPDDYEKGFLLNITVVKCHGAKCGHEHAIFPVWICPYSHFSYPFIISILSFFFDEADRNLARTARVFHIDRSEVRKLVQKYEDGKIMLRELSLAKDSHMDFNKLLRIIKERAEKLRAFLEEYLHLTGLPFLLRHALLPFGQRKMTVSFFNPVRDKNDIP